MNLFKNATPKYEYHLPHDTEKVITDAIAMGGIKAIEMFSPEHTPARGEIELLAHTGCANLKQTIKGRKPTNNPKQLEELYTKSFTNAFFAFHAHYLQAPEKHQEMIAAAQSVGWDVIFVVLQRNAQKSRKAQPLQGVSHGNG